MKAQNLLFVLGFLPIALIAAEHPKNTLPMAGDLSHGSVSKYNSESKIQTLHVNTPPHVKVGEMPNLENPITTEYLQAHLRSGHPRLILTPEIEAKLQLKLKTDPVVQNVYAAIQLNAESVFDQPLLTREKIGKRLLSVSREMLWRMNVLGIVYRIEKDSKVLERINDELLAVSAFTDWNPSHFLDVGEMSVAFAIALDWVGEDLPVTTVQIAQRALIDKGLLADGKAKARITKSTNNWNQVCNGGMIAAALAVAELEPELAAETIGRALDILPRALVYYSPDGAHPEGPEYWNYATVYTALTSSMLESALGSDFGIYAYPGIEESAMYRVLMDAPSDWYYNYGDSPDKRSSNGDLVLAWFASQSGDSVYIEKERFLREPNRMGKLPRYAGAGLVWLAEYEPKLRTPIPEFWAGRGLNPVIVLSGGNGYYLGAKGGSGHISHGSMDAGSFVFELNGVRWSHDPGRVGYHDVEKTGFNLWSSEQDGDRWQLLSKNNYGHSTLTVNGALHRADGHVPLLGFKDEYKPEACFDLTAAFGGAVLKAIRSFQKESDSSLVVSDSVIVNEQTERITWQMLTIAEVRLTPGGALLEQQGQQLNLECLTHPNAEMKLVPLDPPPHALDRKINGLKRIEISLPVTGLSTQEIGLKVRLFAEE